MTDRATMMMNRESLRHKACCCDGAGFFAVDVPTVHPLFGKAIPCVCRRDSVAKDRAQRLRKRSGMSAESLARWSFMAFEPAQCAIPPRENRAELVAVIADAKRACEEFAKNPQGWLVLVGDVGTGKSHLAHAIGASALHQDIPVYAATAPDMLDMLRASYADGAFDQVFSHLRDVGLLIIDDMGTQKATAWTVEKLFQIIDHRYRTQLPMVVTSNIPLAAAEGRIDRRILSRLQDGAERPGGWVRVLALPVSDFRRRRRSRVAA